MMTLSPLQIAYITGRSQPGQVQLTLVQRVFIGQLAGAGRQTVRLNFPYAGRSEESLCRSSPGLLRASLNNSRDYLISRCSGFQKKYHSAVGALLGQAQHTVLLAGSCGLELFNNLGLSARLMTNVSVIAYGPVTRQRPQCSHILIQGDRDWLSKAWFPRVDDKVPCGHMNYLSTPEVLTLCQRFITDIEVSLR